MATPRLDPAHRLDAVARTFSENLSVAGGLLLLFSAIYVTAEVLARKLFAVSLEGANELSGYVMAISSAWAFSYALNERAHIRIDAAYQLLPLRWRALIDVVSVASLAIMAGLFLWFAFRLLSFAWNNGQHSNTPLRTPLWIPLALWYAGLILFFLTSLFVTVRAAIAFARGDLTLVRQIAGMASNEAELEAPDLVALAEQSIAKKAR